MRLSVNGSPVETEAAPEATLLDVLRRQLGLTGAAAAELGECGACDVSRRSTNRGLAASAPGARSGRNHRRSEGQACDRGVASRLLPTMALFSAVSAPQDN